MNGNCTIVYNMVCRLRIIDEECHVVLCFLPFVS